MQVQETLYIYFPCIREIWRFAHPRSHISRGQGPTEIWPFRGWTNFHISLMQGKWMFYSTRPTFWWILPRDMWQIIVSPCQIASCHPLDFVCCRERYFLNQSYLALNFPGYKTGNVSTIKMLPQNKTATRFHVPVDTEIEELLEQKDAKNTKKSTASSVWCFRQFLEESGRERNFEDFVLTVLLTLMFKSTAEVKENVKHFHALFMLFYYCFIFI